MTLNAKRKVGVAAAADAAGPPPPPDKRRGGDGDGRSLRALVAAIGAAVEALIDASPLGVSTPAPWSPTTDRRKALLSDPLGALGGAAAAGGAAVEAPPARLLALMREGLAAVAPFEPPGAAPGDGVAPRAAAATTTTAGVDKWGNAPRAAEPLREAALEARALRRAASAQLAALAARAKRHCNCRGGLVVTADDASADGSVFSLVPGTASCDGSSGESGARSPPPAVLTVADALSDGVPGSLSCGSSDGSSFEDVPSVVTEIVEGRQPAKDGAGVAAVPTEVLTTKESPPPEDPRQTREATLEDLMGEEEEWVLT